MDFEGLIDLFESVSEIVDLSPSGHLAMRTSDKIKAALPVQK